MVFSLSKAILSLRVLLLSLAATTVAGSEKITAPVVERKAITPEPNFHHRRLFSGQLPPAPSFATIETVEPRQDDPFSGLSLTYPSSAPFIEDLTATSSTLKTRTDVRPGTSDEQASGMTPTWMVSSTMNTPLIPLITITIVNTSTPQSSASSTELVSAIASESACVPQATKTVTVVSTEKSKTATVQPTTTYSWSEYNYNSTTSTETMIVTSQGNFHRVRGFTMPSATPCSSNTALLCVEPTLGAANLTSGPRPNHSRTWSTDSTPTPETCADNRSFECTNIGSVIITLSALSSFTSLHKNSITSNLKNTTGILSTTLSSWSSKALESTSTSTSLPGASPSSISTTSKSHSSSSPPISVSSSASPSPCESNSSLVCIVQGNITTVIGTFTLQKSSTSRSVSTSSFVSSFSKLTSSTLSSSVETSSISQSTITLTTTLPPTTSIPTQNEPYPYPTFTQGSGATNGIRIPRWLLLLCFLAAIAATSSSVDISSANYLSRRSDTQTASETADGNFGIGVPGSSTATSKSEMNSELTPGTYGRTSPTASATASSAAQSNKPDSMTKTTSSLVQPAPEASSSFSPFPQSFIVPVTDTAASTGSSGTPASSQTIRSGSSKLRVPGILLLFCTLFFSVAATIAPTPEYDLDVRSNPTTEHRKITTVQSPLLKDEMPFVTEYVQTTVVFNSSQFSGQAATSTFPETGGSSKLKIPTWLLFLCSLVSLAAANTTSTSTFFGDLAPGLCAGQTDILSCDVVDGTTFWLSPLSTLTPTSSSSHGPSTAVITQSATSILTLTSQQSRSTYVVTASATTTTVVHPSSTSAPPASSNPAKSGSSKAKIPILLLLFYSLLSVAAAQSWTFGLYDCLSQTNCEVADGRTNSWSIASSPTSRSSTATITEPTHSASTRIFQIGGAARGSSKAKVPSLLLLCSLFSIVAVNLIPTLSSDGELSAKLEGSTITPLPPLNIISISLPKHEMSTVAATSMVTAVFPVPHALPDTRQGVKRVSTPFVSLLMYCVAATLYSAGLGSKKDEKRDNDNGENEK